MPFRLHALDQSLTIAVDKPILLVGRQAECDIQLESSKVSRRHCFLAKAAHQLFVRDLESTNGIRVNGQRVEASMLSHGDELVIGNIRFRVAQDPSESLPPPPGPRPSAIGEPTAGPIPADQLVSCEYPVPLLESDAQSSHSSRNIASGSR
ncbi:MAG TPA: FHA domain-containing protein [Gemmatales bacterium]|nr:FHA domain-containing protein [Gemmatales bacterium]HMP60216.1 FHA domain-containing protein [Gemmatales bacterium]